MKKFISVGLFLTALALTGCGQMVEVPPAHVGKVMTKDGYQPNVISTSKFRLAPCFAYCDKLVILDVSDRANVESLSIFIPKDKLELSVDIQTTLSLNATKTESLFGTIAPVEQDDNTLIPWINVYNTYAKQIVLTEAREYLSQYSIAEIASSMEKVNNDLRAMLTKAISAKTPFDVRYVGITKIKYPSIITEAQENAARRREQIQQEEAQLEISQVSLQRELVEAQLQRQIDFEKAEGEAAAQIVQREAVDPRVLQLRKLENERAWIEKWDGKLPVTAMGDAIPMVQLNQGK
jgi:regulator of protease activity HflC (stomatin/prohibitin superfamily)